MHAFMMAPAHYFCRAARLSQNDGGTVTVNVTVASNITEDSRSPVIEADVR